MLLDLVIFTVIGVIVGAVLNLFAPKSGYAQSTTYWIAGISIIAGILIVATIGHLSRTNFGVGTEPLMLTLGIYAVLRKQKARSNSPDSLETSTMIPTEAETQPGQPPDDLLPRNNDREPSRRLEALDQLRDLGKISHAEYEKQRAKIIQDI